MTSITNFFHLLLPSHWSFHLQLPLHISSHLHFHRRSRFNCCSHCISFHLLISSTDDCAHSSHILLPLLISFHLRLNYKFLSFDTSIAFFISLATSISFFLSLALPSQISFQLLLALHFISFADFQHR